MESKSPFIIYLKRFSHPLANGISLYAFQTLSLSIELIFKMSGNFLLSLWKVRQHFCEEANIRISCSRESGLKCFLT